MAERVPRGGRLFPGCLKSVFLGLFGNADHLAGRHIVRRLNAFGLTGDAGLRLRLGRSFPLTSERVSTCPLSSTGRLLSRTRFAQPDARRRFGVVAGRISQGLLKLLPVSAGRVFRRFRFTRRLSSERSFRTVSRQGLERSEIRRRLEAKLISLKFKRRLGGKPGVDRTLTGLLPVEWLGPLPGILDAGWQCFLVCHA